VTDSALRRDMPRIRLLAGLGVGLAGIAGAAALLATPAPDWQPGTLQDPFLSEASGLAASVRTAGLYWAVNDSGNSPELFALGADGRAIARIPVQGASNRDWEALASGPCPDGAPGGCLIIADIGDNARSRPTIDFVIVREPAPGAAEAPVWRTVTVQLPDGPVNAEAIWYDGRTVTLIEKTSREALAAPSRLYRFDLTASPLPGMMQPAGTLPPQDQTGARANRITDAVRTTDGRLFVRTYDAVLEVFAPDPAAGAPNSWTLRTQLTDALEQAETLAAAPDRPELITTSEGIHPPILRHALQPHS
jgi:hypothetical protein